MALKTLREARISRGTRVILRADFDVSIRHGRIEDDSRLRACIPTIRYILAKEGALRIIAHLGRPGGKLQKNLTLEPVALRLARLLRKKVVLVRNPFGTARKKRLARSPYILLFENIRFSPGEEKNDADMAHQMAEWGDIYINEAFAESHRVHSSVVALAKILPAYAGLNLEKEVRALTRVMQSPRRPVVIIIGGVKLETKLPMVQKFLRDADQVLVGGAVANALLGKPRPVARPKLILPIDGSGRTVPYEDIGPKTIRLFAEILVDAKTIVWNGPLGRAEKPRFARGTKAIALVLQKSRAFTVVGGGDTIAALKKYKLLRGFDHVSLGGGAMLEFLAGKKLPALEILKK